MIISSGGAYLVNRIRSGAGNRQRVRIGAGSGADGERGPNLAAVTELCDRPGVIEAVDAADAGGHR